MSDLSDRLRALGNTMGGASGGYLCCEAADELDQLLAIIARLAKTADNMPVAQVRSEQVWRRFGPEGLPQGSMYFQFGLAVFRGATHNEMLPIGDCYWTKEAAEAALHA